MDRTYWHKQSAKLPLFPDLVWSKPEQASQAGKLLIIGGNVHGFSGAAEAYAQAGQAGVGIARVLLPDSLQKTVGRVFAAGEYAPSTPSGSFASTALSEFLAMSNWSDGVLLAGDLGHNSETAIVLEKLIEKYSGQLTITGDAADYFISKPASLLERPETVLVIDMPQLQKLAINARVTQAYTVSMDLLPLVDRLHDFTQKYGIGIVTKHHDNNIVSLGGKVSTTKSANNSANWSTVAAAYTGVWWLQNPSKPFESITTAMGQLL